MHSSIIIKSVMQQKAHILDFNRDTWRAAEKTYKKDDLIGVFITARVTISVLILPNLAEPECEIC